MIALLVSQHGYALRVLERFGMADSNMRSTPVDAGTFPQRSEEELDVQRTKLYQQLMGSINYLVIGTRPDLAFTVSMLSTFNSNPNDTHMRLAKGVLRYIKRPANTKRRYNKRLVGCVFIDMYSDASYGTDPDNCKSYSGYVMID